MVSGRIAILIVALSLASNGWAAVTASVDRNKVDLNESFSLEIVADTADQEPDVSVLERDFYVGRGSTISNLSIVNGRSQRTITWEYALMPKRTGELTIPPIPLGAESTQPITVVVSEPDYAPPGQAEIYITSELDVETTWVQAQALLTIKIYRALPVRQQVLREPAFEGVESLVERVGDDRMYQAIIDGTTYDVIERVYAIFPQESGRLQVTPARYEARVLRNGRITGRRVYDSEPQSIEVQPIPAPPADRPDAAWLPARDVRLQEEWSRDPVEAKAGEPLTRHVAISALGQLETQIPTQETPTVDGLNVYPDKPELSRRIEAQGIRGVRGDRYAIIGTVAGEVTLPAVEVPWWNVDTAEWQLATLPERTVRVLPAAEVAPPVEPVASEPQAADEPAEPTGSLLPDGGGFWRRATELLAALWGVTLLAWWWTSRPRREPREAEPPPIHRQQAKHLKAARKAALAGDGAALRRALLDWAALEWPDAAPRSVGALAERVTAPLADELRRLSGAAYGPGDGDWDGAALAKALRSFGVVGDQVASNAEPLPPLMPGS